MDADPPPLVLPLLLLLSPQTVLEQEGRIAGFRSEVLKSQELQAATFTRDTGAFWLGAWLGAPSGAGWVPPCLLSCCHAAAAWWTLGLTTSSGMIRAAERGPWGCLLHPRISMPDGIRAAALSCRARLACWWLTGGGVGPWTCGAERLQSNLEKIRSEIR